MVVWHVCALCVCSVCGDQKRGSDPLGLEFPRVVSHHADNGIQTHILWKNNMLLTAQDLYSPQVHNILLPSKTATGTTY